MSSVVVDKAVQTFDKCNVYLVHIKVHDVTAKIKEVFDSISDTSWIEELNSLGSQMSYKVAAEQTIKELGDGIFKKNASSLTKDTGEYIVSVSAIDALHTEYTHKKIPIAELWKERIKGNPGFDFHSLSAEDILLFGEAKYLSKGTPAGIALDQISDFISKKKDEMVLAGLESFVGVYPIEKFKGGFKIYSAAFSLDCKKPLLVLKNAAKSKKAQALHNNYALYLIGVEFAK